MHCWVERKSMRSQVINRVTLHSGGATSPTFELYQLASGRCRLWAYWFDQDGQQRETIVASSGGGADSNTMPFIYNATLGTKFKVVGVVKAHGAQELGHRKRGGSAAKPLSYSPSLPDSHP